MGRRKDPFWEYAEYVENAKEFKVGFKCIFCQNQFSGGTSRIKSHLSKVPGRDISVCTDVPEEVQREAYIAIGGPNKKAKGGPSTSDFEKTKITSASSSSPSNTLCNKKDKGEVDKLLAQHVVLNNIPIDVIQTASFSRFVQGVAEYGPEYRLPSDSTLKTKLIPDLRMEVEDYIRKVKESWVTTGCTLMLDLWGDKNQGNFISIIAYSPKGAVLMNSFEERKEELNLANIVSSVIEEIGPHHVVQFITNGRKFESVGEELVHKYPRMYKTRCAAHGIHLLLKDIYEEVGWVQKVIDDANSIVKYMYKNTTISSLMREHINNKELKRPCMTRFASNFLMLQSIFNVEEELRLLVASSKWRELDYDKEDMAERVTRIVESTEFWSQCKEVWQVLKPLVGVLQLAESDGSTTGYLYEAMERAEGEIKQMCDNNQAKYTRIRELFEVRHFENIIQPIHAAAAFFNPAFMCSENFREGRKMKEGISFILDNLVANEHKEDFIGEVQIYRIKESSLFTNTAIIMLKTSHPCTWWDFNGDTLPILKKYAIRVLSQPCSSSPCKRNWSAFEAAQTKKGNRLAPELLDNLVYVRMNTMMMEKFKKLEAQGTKPIDLDKLNEVPEYADHEQDWEDDALDAVDEGFDDDVTNDADQSRLDIENSFYQMENIGESIVSAFLQQLLNKLTSPELQEFVRQEQIRTELLEWKDFLWKIYAVLDDAEEKQMEQTENSELKIWLSKLTDLAYDVEDILDEIGTEALRHKLMVEHQASSTALNSSAIISFREDANLHYSAEESLEKMGTDDISFEALQRQLMVEDHASTSNVRTLNPASSSGLNPSALNFIVKIRSEIDEITSRLHEIVTQKDNLDLREKAGRRTNKLRGRPPTAFLVDESHVYGSDDENCLSLFVQHALHTTHFDGHPNLKDIAEEIVKRCEGLPLAAKTLGCLLSCELNRDFWEDILNSKIWDLPVEKSGIVPALRLSYHHLPSYLKRCFAYCAIFPKGYEFDKEELVLLWMAEGFLQEPEGKKHMEDLGHEYFLELLSRSFFQQASANKSRFVMHDLINDLAKSIAGEICFNLEGDTLGKSPEKVRHLAFNRGPYDVSQRFEVISQMKSLRTFLALPVLVSTFDGRFLSNKVLHDLLPKLRYLRALSLTGYEIRELPDSIGDLKHLRYLNLSYSKIEKLPESMSALLNLQTLILRGCRKLTTLPAGIGNLINMDHLDIIDTDDLDEMPSGIGKLISLQTLPKFIVGEGDRLKVRDLKNLSDLRGQLSILKLQNVVKTEDAKAANLKEKQGLDELVLGWRDDVEVSERSDYDDEVSVQSDDDDDDENSERSDDDEVSEWSDNDKMQVLEHLQPHRNLKKLTITSYGSTEFPSWVGHPSFSNLVQLNLHYCRKITLLPSLWRLPSLKNLSIKGMDAVKVVGVEFYGVDSPSVKAFSSLESLSFEDMLEWVTWASSTGVEQDVGKFPCLRKLVIHNCPKLIGKLPMHFVSLDNLHISRCPSLGNSIVRLPSLHELRIEECNAVVLLSLVDLISLTTLKIREISGLASLDILAQMVALEIMEIENCSGLMYLLEYKARLKKLVVKRCPQLVSLAGEEGGLLACSNLKELKLEGCGKLVSFPATGVPYTLKHLELVQCEALESLPDGMMILGGKNNQCFLEELVIDQCPSLKSFPRGMLPTMLKNLKISLCTNLESLPEGMMLDDNNSNNTFHLKSLEISYCNQLKSLPERMLLNNTSLEVIHIVYCRNLSSLPLECLHKLTHLSELKISDCPALESFPERGFSIPNLKSLEIEYCENLKSLPNQMHNFTSLQKLTVWNCDKIVSFPEGGLPPNLTSLKICNCENLKQSMSEWGLHRLSSLRQLRLEYTCPTESEVSFPDDDCSMLPITLTHIYIEGLKNLESISRGIKNLTSLEKLEIWFCPNLHSLPKEGLPPLLGYLDICGCPRLKERCLKEKGEYWPIISHIPCVEID